MGESPQPDNLAGTPSPGSGPPVVVVPTALVVESGSPRWRRLVPAWVISGTVHALLLSAFVFFNVPTTAESVLSTEQVVIETKVEENKPLPNLEETDVGNDPDTPTQFDTPRMEDISVPGPANPSEAVGLVNGADVPPVSVTPPPGLGTSLGQGGTPDAMTPGKGNPIGLPGSIGGALLKPGGFGGRSGATRERLVQEGGGNKESEASVARGLRWLANHQGPSGNWSLDGFDQYGHCNCGGHGMNNDIAATAFGLLPFLGAGHTHRPGPDRNNLYVKNVERGLKYLLLRQNAQGDFGGGMYSHGLATIAVCEAYGLTSDPALQRAAQRAINFIVAAQSDNGGWRYTPRSGGDTSVVGWQLMALKSGQMAGLEVPVKTFAGATRWLDSVASPDGGRYRYTPSFEYTPTMTAVGLLCRQYLGWGPRNPGLQSGVGQLRLTPPAKANTIYYTYYATQVMHHVGSDAWEFWNPLIRDQLIAHQDKGTQRPHQLGSWGPEGDVWGKAGGRIMTTSLAVLTLEVYYRHLPLYRRGEIAGVR